MQAEFQAAASEELVAILERVDAVITTPSTALLEAMLTVRPVAALDYHNVPRFVATAWTISAAEQIAPVLAELLDPAPRKMAFQEMCLRDSLECDEAAAPRVARLIREMVAAARALRPGRGGACRRTSRERRWRDGARRRRRSSELYPGQGALRRTGRPRSSRSGSPARRRTTSGCVRRFGERGLASGLREFGRRLVKALEGRRTGAP